MYVVGGYKKMWVVCIKGEENGPFLCVCAVRASGFREPGAGEVRLINPTTNNRNRAQISNQGVWAHILVWQGEETIAHGGSVRQRGGVWGSEL